MLYLERISKSYPEEQVLIDVSMSLPTGSCNILAGKCGCGKSVLLRILAGLEEPNSGTVYFKGQKLYNSTSHKTHTSLLMQDINSQLLGDNVWDDIHLYPSMSGINSTEAHVLTQHTLNLFGLWDIRNKKTHLLSDGQARLVLLAGIFTQNTPIILLDEPFANLDFNAIKQIRHGFDILLSTGKTLLIATHEIEKVISFTHNLLILDQGTIVVNQSIQTHSAIDWNRYHLKNPYAPAWEW